MNLALRPSSADSAKPQRLPGNLNANRRLSQWLRIHADGTVSVFSGKVEIGQGILTALAQIAAEDLDVDVSRIRMVAASTARSPNETVTSGSLSIQDSGTAIRYACAEARAIYLHAAALRLGLPQESLTVQDGEIRSPEGRRTSYWELAGEPLLEREASGAIAPKKPDAHRIIGKNFPRLDLPDKFFARPRFIHDMQLPGMLYARVLRPPTPGAALADCDESQARALPGIAGIVRDGSFLAVVAEREEIAVTAHAALQSASRWRTGPELPETSRLTEFLKSQPAETSVVDEKTPQAGAAVVARRLAASYAKPYLAHASLAPSCAIALWEESALRVWTHSQGIYNLRADLAIALQLPPENIIVQHVEGAGCYGHNAADDAALDAALVARALPGRPVQVQWTREDELSWAPFGPAMAIDLEAGLDENGNIVQWRHEIWSNGHGTRPGRGKTPALLAASHLARPFEPPMAVNAALANGGGAERNSVPIYDFPAHRIVNHRLLAMPLRTSALRSLGAFANVFALESFMDELAADQGADPVAFRLRYLKDPRGRAVIEAAARKADWNGRRKAEGRGHGIGFARYKNMGAWLAAVAEIEAEREIRVKKLTIAVDVGLVVNPDGVVNQIEGGAIMATSWALKEAVAFDRAQVTSSTWEAYPILRFSEVPAVEVEIIDRPEERPLGAGEASMGPTAAAIANAVFDALGVRVRSLPLTAERIAASI